MPRRAEIQVRTLDPDPIYNSRLVTQVVNRVMTRGKRSTAERIVYGALEKVGEAGGWSKGALFKVLRLLVTGGSVSPPMHYTLALLPRDMALARLDRVL